MPGDPSEAIIDDPDKKKKKKRINKKGDILQLLQNISVEAHHRCRQRHTLNIQKSETSNPRNLKTSNVDV
jgi:hypothetical protein